MAQNSWDKRLTLALDIGEQMAVSGAEVSRVEDSVSHILTAFGCLDSDVLSITTSLIATVNIADYGSMTQTRRLATAAYDMNRLEKMNALSRAICDHRLDPDQARARYEEIIAEKPYSFLCQMLFYMGIAFSFALFFGGTPRDALLSTLIAILFKFIDEFGKRYLLNRFLLVLLSSLLGGFLAILAVRAGLADSVSKISIGDVMILIPGVILTNSVRDMFGGDTITGGTHVAEASLVAIMIALGFVTSSAAGDRLFVDELLNVGRSWSVFTNVIIGLLTAFLGSIAYAGSFNVKKRQLLFVGLGGLLAWCVYVLLGFVIASEPLKYLLSAVAVNIYAERMAVVKRVPATVFIVGAIMPLVPGSGLYETMALLISRQWGKFASKGLETVSIALALGFGILIASSIFKSLKLAKSKRR